MKILSNEHQLMLYQLVYLNSKSPGSFSQEVNCSVIPRHGLSVLASLVTLLRS